MITNLQETKVEVIDQNYNFRNLLNKKGQFDFLKKHLV